MIYSVLFDILKVTLLFFYLTNQYLFKLVIRIHMKKFFIIGTFLITFFSVRSQDSISLLPEHYMLTQKFLWSEKGLMRNFDSFSLNEENRNREIEIRDMLTTLHQISGGISLLAMVGTGITGQMIYKGNNQVKDLHGALAGVSSVAYFGSLSFKLFSPPGMTDREGGFTKLKIHKILSVVHVTGMISTLVLSDMIEDKPELRPYHKAAAITAFSSLALATFVIKL